jgi:chromosome segregation ATPase
MDADLAVLEHKLALLIARVEGLRRANAELERDLAQARTRNRELSKRIEAASVRLDALLDRLPEGQR